MLTELTQIPDAALPVEALKQHLRMGTAFDLGAVQDPVLGSFLRAATAAIEARTAKVLIRRDYLLELTGWSDPEGHAMPLAPAVSVAQVTLVARDGAASTPEISDFAFTPDGHAPRLVWQRGPLPAIPTGGRAEIRFTAGYSEDYDGLPADLRQAVMLLAAHYYEYRDATALGEGCMPFGVTSLVARYRRVRLGFGA